ncbi:hypothetical protein NDU88_005422 [Pleurodeles waltl]|uniref:Uncharacterized protein n=1 Tax=Pleurodeles waltl TaxID=8319 RepID=A0AAV7PI22_PLEWA|nr:hypothetical protein NDU88_005422 [Pleurodeles waltl]
MGRHRQTNVSQGNTMEQYTTVVPLPQRAARLGGTDAGQSGITPAEEPSRAEIPATIRGSRVALEGKIETVAVEVNLLRADLRKVSDKVKVAGGSLVELQMEVGALRKQMAQASFTVGRLEARLEDAEGRSRRNNIRLLGFPERAEGSAAETFVENWIKDVLQPVGLSRMFVQPEEVWRWLEMWDKAAPGRPAGSGGVAHQASRADSPDWRIRGGGLTKDTVARGSVEDPALRIEIQQDGTMPGRWMAPAEGRIWTPCWPPRKTGFLPVMPSFRGAWLPGSLEAVCF